VPIVTRCQREFNTRRAIRRACASHRARGSIWNEFLGERRAPEPAPDLFSGAAARKAERQAAILNAVSGRAQPQPRDVKGRFATGFDGGARQTVVPRRQSHDEWLSNVLRSGRADVGANV
jgi:hypothetical protein